MVSKNNTFSVTLSKFYLGQAPLVHLDSLSEMGESGQYTVGTNVDVVSVPGVLTQGPGLANLTAGTQAGAVTELINHILDVAVASDVTYGIGATKLFKISSTAVASDATWPHAITLCLDGESVVSLRGNLYYFFNKTVGSGGDIGKYDLASSFDDDWGSTVPSGAGALQFANHPVAVKEDIMCFGNGRYMGTYLDASTTINLTKLDFGIGTSVDDVVFHANQWYIAVNSGVTGTNRTRGQIYLYDGGVTSAILSDETAVGVQRIGFLYPLNGVVYVAYQDLSSTGGYKIGYLSGRQLKTLRHFTGSLPNFAQKTLFQNTILFLSSGSVWSCGAVIDQLPVQISQLADGGYATCGALAAPFGTPMIASTDGGSNFKLAKFSGYGTASSWKSLVISVMQGRMLGLIDDVIVTTKSLGSGASCTLTIETNQFTSTSTPQTIATTGKRRHVFNNLGLLAFEDFRIALDFSSGSATNDCGIKKIQIVGHYVER